MKFRLPKVFFAALVAAVCCSDAEAEVKPDGIDYTLTDNGDGTYAASVIINDGVKTRMTGGEYVNQTLERVYQTKIHDVDITMTGGTITYILAAGNFRAQPVTGDVTMNITGGYVDRLVGGNHMSTALTGGYSTDYTQVGNVESVTMNVGGTAQINTLIGGSSVSPDDGWPNSTFVAKYSTYENINISVSDNAKVGTLYGAGYSYSAVKGNEDITINGGTINNIQAVGDSKVDGDVIVRLNGGTITGSVEVGSGTVGKSSYLYVGEENAAYNGTIGSITGFNHIVIASGSSLTTTSGNLFEVDSLSYTISAENTNTPIVTTTGDVAVDSPITLNLTSKGTLASGKYMIIDATGGKVDTTNWTSDTVTINGLNASFNDLSWDNNILTLIYRGEEVDCALVSNWGVFKSSQAFTGTLWGNRTNACVLSTPVQQPCTDAKGNCIPATAPTGATLAWGTAYGQSARIEGAGADYSLYGGAMGIEHHFVSGRSIGTATGYDWGTVSPFGGKDVDQETWHIALYGRAATWAIGQNSSVAVDLSASYGKTTSETDTITDEWKQDTIQLDARVSYFRKLNNQVTGSIFAGAQYFAADSADVAGMKVCSMQNLRTEGGVGVSYKASQKAAVYAEASIYNDAMRHNPGLISGGYRFTGTNPGRLGGSISVGAQYDLNDNWSVRGSYSFDAADDSTEHNLNAGAVYKF